MAMQDKQDHFSIRKLSIGAASVLLGFTFFGLNSKTAKADTVIPTQQTEENTKTKENISPQDTTTPPGSISDAQNSTTAVKAEKTNKPEDGPNLATFSGLSSFLRATNSDNKQDDSAKTDKTENSADKNDQQDSATNSEQNSNLGQQDQTTDQKPVDTTDSSNTADITNEDQTDANEDIDTTPIDTKEQENSSQKVSVNNWEDFAKAYQDINVSEIDITANIRSNKGNGRDRLSFPGRKLLIKSAGDATYTIDFRSVHPKIESNTIGDITYENLKLKSADFYGVVNTRGGKSARVTFRNIDFTGSQLLYTDSNTDIIFEGIINAETTEMPMETGGVDDGSKQQLLEFTKDNNSITFKAGCKFKGATFGGTLIEMKGKNNVLNVEDGADVTLIPLKTYNGKNGANNGQYTRPISAIYIEGDSQVNVNGTVNIRIGESSGLKYDGVQNAGQARAIYLESKTSKVNIGRGGTINVNTNGNISTKNGQHLIYVGGDFTIHSGGALKITGENMGNYSGTLVQIDGKANVQNGGFEIQLVGDAGTGAIKLVDVAKTGQLIVNNPTSLVLDAHLNKNDTTSIIGDSKITVTNVRQLLNLNDFLGKTDGSQNNLVLPPFHVLQVEKTKKTIAVNTLELLNGMRKFDLDQVKNDNPQLAEILKNLPESIRKLLETNNGKTYDDLFDAVIEAAFSNKENPGYNNIRFIPANPSGFLDIDPANVTVTDQEDGSKIIKGQVLNYDPAKDGPASDNLFQSVLPGGTEAYVLASFKDSGVYKNGQAIIDSAIPNPYADTIDTYRGEANDLALLPTKFAAQVAADGTFTITLPPEITTKMAKDATIQLTPHANFIDYSPLDIADGIRPTIVSLGIKPFSEIQQEAAQAIKDAISTAKANKPKSLTEDQEKAFTDAMNEAAKYAANIRDDNYESDKSVYGVQSSKTAISEVNTRKKTALDIVAKAVQAAKGQADFEKAKSDAITKLTQQANDQISKFPSQAQTIINAKDQAISNVQAPETNNTNIEQVVNDGITAINQAGKDYRDNVKTDINQSITKAEKAIDEVAKDENVKSPVDELITGLKDRLKRPKEIVATDGDLDQDDNEKAI
ncbi:MAG: YSIRK-type signal peptide-containing protein, partial [Lactobacillus sp.]|nr:YSIRK-type signal peptide-containing protein [Lactobacillus sp.]